MKVAREGCSIAPMGCGHRLCPRCGRSKGRGMVRRIFGWLAAESHGDIFMHCLTQPVIAGETLAKARARMRAKERRYTDHLRGSGMLAIAAVTHIVWSTAAGGWHYHVHYLLELEAGQWTVEELLRLYASVAHEDLKYEGDSCSLVVAAGPAEPTLSAEHPCLDFWNESTSKLGRAVQYPVRDIAQGFTADRLGGDVDRVAECVAVLLKHAKGWKLRRTLGRWRKAPPPVVAVEKPAEEGKGDAATTSSAPAVAVRIGFVNQLAKKARLGDRFSMDVFRRLESSIRNSTDFGRRFIALCRLCSGRPLS